MRQRQDSQDYTGTGAAAAEWVVAPDSVASPSQMRPIAPGDMRWYLPTLGERLRLMGWRNVLWVPPALMIAFLISSLTYGHFFWLGIWWWKPLIFCIALPTSMAFGQARSALKNRADPFCIHCGYSLVGIEEGHPCPECGEAISHALCREYQRDPNWFIQRFKARHQLPPADVPFEAGPGRTAGDGT